MLFFPPITRLRGRDRVPIVEVGSAIGLEFSTTKVATLEIPRERDATSRTREDAQRRAFSREINLSFSRERERENAARLRNSLGALRSEPVFSLSVRRGIFSCGPRCLVAFERLTQRCLGVQTLTQRRHVVPSFSTPWDRGRERGGESKRDGHGRTLDTACVRRRDRKRASGNRCEPDTVQILGTRFVARGSLVTPLRSNDDV